MTDTLLSPLDYYARHHCALFPIPAGQKNPTGIVPSFKHDHSTDPAQWATWSAAHPGCNFGVVAFASRLIIVDIDTSGGEAGRAEAWRLWCELCASWNVPPLAPTVQSARGGWHVYFAVPADVDPATLRQPDAIKKRINVRCIGYTVAAGSYYDGTAKGEQSGPYLLMSDLPPHPAPAALIAHCTRAPSTRPTSAAPPNSRDTGDVAALLRWLSERDAFAAYEDWCQIGMALRIEFGDAGFDLWELCHDSTVTPDLVASKWESFATDPTADSVTLATFLQRAHSLGWRGQIRRSSAAMFDGVAAIAAAAGASLPTSQGVPMLAGQAELARLAEPIVSDFLAAIADAPNTPRGTDYPTLPEALASHALYSPMRSALARLFAVAEPPNKFKPAIAVDLLAVLHVLHKDVFDSVCRRLRSFAIALPDRKIAHAAASLTEAVERITVTLEKWEYDPKGQIESDNPDNVIVLLGVLGLEIRWNAWLEQMEMQGGTDPNLKFPDWTYVDDPIIWAMLTRARRTKTRFRPTEGFLRETLITIAKGNAIDPVIDRLAHLEKAWDKTPRLSTWLSRYCGTPCDQYYQAVSRNIVGGMVARARNPGIKLDTMAVLYGRGGTGKSTLAAVLADMGQSSLSQILLGNGQHFSDSILLGDASKELVLSLAGNLVVEIGEMGMRGNTDANHVKAMVSRQVDAGRTAYARSVTKRRRRNIFIGTTNDDEPLQDPTGNRRFLPVPMATEIDLDGLSQDIGQIVGEAAALHSAGASFDIPRSVWGLATTYQEAARNLSPVEEVVNDWFDRSGALYVLSADIRNAFKMAGFRPSERFGVYMKRLGWRHIQANTPGRDRVWIKHDNNKITECNCLVPSQTANGRVQMILRRDAMPALSPLPALPSV